MFKKHFAPLLKNVNFSAHWNHWNKQYVRKGKTGTDSEVRFIFGS